MQKFKDPQIRNYLQEIKTSIQNDVGIAIKAYMDSFFNNDTSAGFFAVPRMLFPEIDGLGSYLTGNPRCSGKNIKRYLSEVMSEIDPRYQKFATFIVAIYRNGLLHQHSPKKFKFQYKERGWQFGVSNTPIETQRRYHLNFRSGTLEIDMNVFYSDVIKSIEIAADLITSKYKKEFEGSFKKQNKFLTKNSLLREAKRRDKSDQKSRYVFPKDFKFLYEFQNDN